MPPERFPPADQKKEGVPKSSIVSWPSESNDVVSVFSENMVTDVPEGESLFDTPEAANDNRPPTETLSDIWSDDHKAQIAEYMKEELVLQDDENEAISEASIDTETEREALREDMEDRLIDSYTSGLLGHVSFDETPAYTLLADLDQQLNVVAGDQVESADIEKLQAIVDATVAIEDGIRNNISPASYMYVPGLRRDVIPEQVDVDDPQSLEIVDRVQSDTLQPTTEFEAINAAWDDVQAPDEVDEPAVDADAVESDVYPDILVKSVEPTAEERETAVIDEVEAELPESRIARARLAVDAATENQSNIPRSKILEAIDARESVGRGWFNFEDTASPSVIFGDMPFNRFADLAQGINKQGFQSFMQNEFRGVNMKYEALKKWGNDMVSIRAFAEREFPHGQATTQEVLEGYMAEQLAEKQQHRSLFSRS